MDANNPNFNSSYAFNGRIMLIFIVSLFAIVIFMICLHCYTRWYLLHMRRRQARIRARRRSNFFFSVNTGNASVAASSLGGLDSSVISLIPEFVYSSKEERRPEEEEEELECAVCLSVFQEGEKGRVLPKCGHSFHIDCIDMWFHSHSTCPLCRSPVEPMPPPPPQPENYFVSVSVAESVLAASSDLPPTENSDPLTSSSSSVVFDRRKEIELAIDVHVPRRRNELEEEGGTSSAPSQAFKSPGTRLRSFKRILSINRKGIIVSTESDVERGSDESTTHQ